MKKPGARDGRQGAILLHTLFSGWRVNDAKQATNIVRYFGSTGVTLNLLSDSADMF
jgi:hypothetical protein